MSLPHLFKTFMPINRNTATVLPGIVCADGFAHINRFWNLLGIEGIPHVAPTRTQQTSNFSLNTTLSSRFICSKWQVPRTYTIS